MSDAVNSGRKRSAEMDTIKQTTGVMLTNDYSGFQPDAGIRRLTERISPNMAAEEFFSEYVERRRPAVFEFLLADEQWKGDQWTVSYISHRAGTAMVTVEDRPSCDVERTFQEMPYRDFVSSLIDGETRYQLTNSDVQCSMSDLRDRNGFLSTVLQPLHALADDFPLRPTILGNLIPHQVLTTCIILLSVTCQFHTSPGTHVAISYHNVFCIYFVHSVCMINGNSGLWTLVANRQT